MTIETYLHLIGEMEKHEQAGLLALVRQENTRDDVQFIKRNLGLEIREAVAFHVYFRLMVKAIAEYEAN